MRAHHDTPVRALQLLEIEVKAALAPRNTSRGTDEHRTNVCAVQMRARAPPLVAAKSGQSPAWPSRSLGAGGKLIASCGAEDTVRATVTKHARSHTFFNQLAGRGEVARIDCSLCYFLHISILAPLMLSNTHAHPCLVPKHDSDPPPRTVQPQAARHAERPRTPNAQASR